MAANFDENHNIILGMGGEIFRPKSTNIVYNYGNIYWTKKLRIMNFNQKFSSQIWHDNDFSIFTFVKTPLSTI